MTAAYDDDEVVLRSFALHAAATAYAGLAFVSSGDRGPEIISLAKEFEEYLRGDEIIEDDS